jgi:hypothetical protein
MPTHWREPVEVTLAIVIAKVTPKPAGSMSASEF